MRTFIVSTPPRPEISKRIDAETRELAEQIFRDLFIPDEVISSTEIKLRDGGE